MTATTTPPQATVVMPVRDEERHIAASLAAVLAQELPAGALEVLVVDGGSTDRTPRIARETARGARFPVRVLDNPGRVAAAALNIGAAAAQADVVVRVDGHAEVPPDYVRTLLDVLRHERAAAAGGVAWPCGEGAYGRAVAAALRIPLGHGGAAFRTGGGAQRDVDTVAFPAYRRDALRAAGGFDEDLVRNQDDDLHLRLRRAGGRVVLVPRLRVRYHCRGDRASLYGQYRAYGFWKVVGARRRGVPSSWRALGPPALVAVAALTVVPLLGLVALSRAQNRWGALATMHLAYGAGFWSALLRGGRGRERAA